MHDKLRHIPYSVMDKMVYNNILPKQFASLKGNPFCVLLAFMEEYVRDCVVKKQFRKGMRMWRELKCLLINWLWRNQDSCQESVAATLMIEYVVQQGS